MPRASAEASPSGRRQATARGRAPAPPPGRRWARRRWSRAAGTTRGGCRGPGPSPCLRRRNAKGWRGRGCLRTGQDPVLGRTGRGWLAHRTGPCIRSVRLCPSPAFAFRGSGYNLILHFEALATI
eukprot:5647696-Pleurochrysis_carterae.AAC.1